MSDPTSGNGDKPRRRRPASIAYTQKVEALKVVDPVLAQLAIWSPRVAYLKAIANRSGLTASMLASSLTEAQILMQKVRRARAHLGDLTRDQPPEISSHSRIVDAQRSLDALETHLSEALLLLAR